MCVHVRNGGVCVCVFPACALTFQSMVEKKECRLISSTPSGPAPEDTDHSGSVNLARALFILLRGSQIHTLLSVGFPACDLCGCQNVTSSSKASAPTLEYSSTRFSFIPTGENTISFSAPYLVCWRGYV